MLKLKKNVVDFLMLKVDSHVVEEILRDLERLLYESTPTSNRWRSLAFLIKKEESKFNSKFIFEFSPDDFEEAQDSEELKPYKWYPREKFDGNPRRYWIVELDGDGCVDCYDTYLNELIPEVTHFMFIEPIKEQEND